MKKSNFAKIISALILAIIVAFVFSTQASADVSYDYDDYDYDYSEPAEPSFGDVDCIHWWMDGICQNCHRSHEEVEGHSFTNGRCYCGIREAINDEPVAPACRHSWTDGVCQICHKSHEEVEGHHFVNGWCDCGVLEASNDTPATPVCSHSWVNGVCSSCSATCESVNGAHDWTNKDGVCANCGITCKAVYGAHNWKNKDGICANCGITCEAAFGFWYAGHYYSTYHDWSGEMGICEKCGISCQNAFGTETAHVWEKAKGKCDNCGIPCEEAFGYWRHDWSNADGICNNCGATCETVNRSHYFIDGACGYCKKHCEHEQWAGGESCNCPVCGANVMKLRVEELSAAIETLGNNNGLNEEQVRSLITRMVAVATSGYAYQRDVDNLREMIESLKAPAGITSDEVYEIVNTVVRNVTNDCYYRIGDLYSQYEALSDQIRRLDYTVSQLGNAGLSDEDIDLIREEICEATRTAINEFIAGDFNAAIRRIMNDEARIDEIVEFNSDISDAVDELYDLIFAFDNDRFTADDKAAFEIKVKNEVSIMIHEYCDGKYEELKNRILFDEDYINTIAASVKEMRAAVEVISNDYLTSADRDALEAKISEEISAIIKDYCDGQYEALKNRILFDEYYLGSMMTSIDEINEAVSEIANDYLTEADRESLQAKIDSEIASAVAEIRDCDLSAMAEKITFINSDVIALRAAILNLRVSVGEIAEDYLTSADKAEIEAKINAVVAEAINSFTNCELNAALDRIVVAEGNVAEINEILCFIKQEIDAIECDYLTAEDRIALEEKISAEIEKAICEFTGNDLEAVRNEIRSVDEKVATLAESIAEINRALVEIRENYLTADEGSEMEMRLREEIRSIENNIRAEITNAFACFAENDFAESIKRIGSAEAAVKAINDSLDALAARIRALEESGYISRDAIEFLILTATDGMATESDIAALSSDMVARISVVCMNIESLEATINSIEEQVTALSEAGYVDVSEVKAMIRTMISDCAQTSELEEAITEINAMVAEINKEMTSIREAISEAQEHQTKSESEIRLLEQSLNKLINDFETINTKLQEQDAMITQQNLKIAEQTVTNRAVVVLLIVSLLASAVAIWRYSKEQ